MPAIAQPDATTVQLAQADAGPPVAHAANDVGGLLDTSKGWTLHIPGPDETGGAAAKTIAAQQDQTAAVPKEVATASVGVTTGSK
jgi:hypothetical protein